LGEEKMGKIFVRVKTEFKALEETKYSEEDLLQEFIYQNPQVMGIINDEGRLIQMIPIAREVPVPDEAGSTYYIDLICLDDEGIVNIIEVKRCSDVRIRREVIGQIFDYASQLCYSGDVKNLREYYREIREAQTSEGANNVFTDQIDQEDYWEKVKTNLQAKKVRLVIAADGIPENLKRIIEFLNPQMDPTELIGIDLRKYGKDDFEVYTSSVIGITEESKVKKGIGHLKRTWDQESFLKDIEAQSGPRARELAQGLIDWCVVHNVRIEYGAGNYEGSIITVYDKGKYDNILFAIYGRGKFYFQFQWLRPPFNTDEWRMKLMEYFNEVLPIPLTTEDMKRRPSLIVTDLDDEIWSRLLGKFELFIKDIETNQN
jgi:hypothetical protein